MLQSNMLLTLLTILAVILYVFTFADKGISDYIIYSTANGIFRYNLKEERHHTQLLTLHNSGFVNIEFEYGTNCIIFENSNEKSLQRLCLSADNSTVETITKYSGYGYVISIAYDWVGENIFWITGNPRQILVARKNGSNQRVLFDKTHLNYPYGLALDPHRRWMYWTDTDIENPRIVRAQMNGNQSTYQVLVKENPTVLHPLLLTLDHQFGNMYWTDSTRHHVMKASVTGENLEIIAFGEDIPQPIGIAMFKTMLYWTDNIKQAIMYTDVRPNHYMVHMLVGNISKIWDLKVVKNQTKSINVRFSDCSTWCCCSKTHESGTKTRTRSCINPFPSNGGAECSGNSVKEDISETNNKEIIIGIAIGAGSCFALFTTINFVFCLAKKKNCSGICFKKVQQENENKYETTRPRDENQHVYMELGRQHSNPENAHDYLTVV